MSFETSCSRGLLHCMRRQLALIFRRDAARVGPEVGVELPVVRAGHSLPQWKGDRPSPTAVCTAARDPFATFARLACANFIELHRGRDRAGSGDGGLTMRSRNCHCTGIHKICYASTRSESTTTCCNHKFYKLIYRLAAERGLLCPPLRTRKNISVFCSRPRRTALLL